MRRAILLLLLSLTVVVWAVFPAWASETKENAGNVVTQEKYAEVIDEVADVVSKHSLFEDNGKSFPYLMKFDENLSDGTFDVWVAIFPYTAIVSRIPLDPHQFDWYKVTTLMNLDEALIVMEELRRKQVPLEAILKGYLITFEYSWSIKDKDVRGQLFPSRNEIQLNASHFWAGTLCHEIGHAVHFRAAEAGRLLGEGGDTVLLKYSRLVGIEGEAKNDTEIFSKFASSPWSEQPWEKFAMDFVALFFREDDAPIEPELLSRLDYMISLFRLIQLAKPEPAVYWIELALPREVIWSIGAWSRPAEWVELDGETYVAARDIADAFGASVEYVPAKKQVVFTKRGNKAVEDVRIVNGRAYVPYMNIWWVALYLGYSVGPSPSGDGNYAVFVNSSGGDS